MFPPTLIQVEKGVNGGSNGITVRKMYNAERKELTDQVPAVNIL